MTRRANHFGLSEIVSSPPHKNISLNTSGKSPLLIRPSHPNEGRCAGHERAVGCDGRDSVGRAVAAAGRDEPRERHAARRPTALPTILAGTGRDARGPARALAGWARTAKSCGPDAPRLASSRVEMQPAQPGSRCIVSPQGDGGKVQGSPGRSRIGRNPLCRESRMIRFTCGLLVRFLRTTAGAIGARLSLRPSCFKEGEN